MMFYRGKIPITHGLEAGAQEQKEILGFEESGSGRGREPRERRENIGLRSRWWSLEPKRG
jgi:hypothetical protein